MKQKRERWYVFEYRDHSGLRIGPRWPDKCFTDGEVNDVCSIRGYPISGVTDEMRAQARLLAAAPIGAELAEAVLEALGWVKEGHGDIVITREPALSLVALAREFQKAKEGTGA